MLEEGLGDEEESAAELNILEQLKKLDLDEKHEDEYRPDDHPVEEMASSAVNLKEAAKGHLRSSDAIFAEERASSKVSVSWLNAKLPLHRQTVSDKVHVKIA